MRTTKEPWKMTKASGVRVAKKVHEKAVAALPDEYTLTEVERLQLSEHTLKQLVVNRNLEAAQTLFGIATGELQKKHREWAEGVAKRLGSSVQTLVENYVLDPDSTRVTLKATKPPGDAA